MAPNNLTPIIEEEAPNYSINVQQPPPPDDTNPGCVFFYDHPESKGNFYDDSFFRDAQKNYEKAIEDLLRNYHFEFTPNCVTANMSAYKDLREVNKKDTQAYGLTELEGKYQIVVDVQGYGGSDISVKAIGDKELVVEGKRVETSPDGKAVTSSFSRRFELPGLVRLDAISSALSKDGVLTVSAPKMNPSPSRPVQSIRANNLEGQQQGNSTAFHNNYFDERQKIGDHQLSNMLSDLDMNSKHKFQTGFFPNDRPKTLVPEVQHRESGGQEMVEESDHYKITLDITGYNPGDISVKAVGERELLIEGKHEEKNQSGSASVKSFNRRFMLPGSVKLESITSSLSLEGKLTIRAPKKQDPAGQQAINQSHIHGVPVNNNSVQQNFSTRVYKTENAAPPQGDAFDDFFSDDFGMRSMMPRRNPMSFMDNARNDIGDSFRNIRTRNWPMDSQQPDGFFNDFPIVQREPQQQKDASNIIESEQDYKVKLDVRNYQPKDISVKAVGDRELLIEGKQIVKQTSGPEINQSFSRKFSLPGLVKLEGIKSSLSPDGFLTITAPKA